MCRFCICKSSYSLKYISTLSWNQHLKHFQHQLWTCTEWQKNLSHVTYVPNWGRRRQRTLCFQFQLSRCKHMSFPGLSTLSLAFLCFVVDVLLFKMAPGANVLPCSQAKLWYVLWRDSMHESESHWLGSLLINEQYIWNNMYVNRNAYKTKIHIDQSDEKLSRTKSYISRVHWFCIS